MIPFANIAALLFTVALLAVTAYFLLGSVPLLALKHDDPVDAKFIQSFYDTYYRIAFIVALGTTVSFALSSRPLFAAGAAVITVLAWVLRRKLIPWMDALATPGPENDNASIPVFRKVHQRAILINLVQLVAIVSSLGSYW